MIRRLKKDVQSQLPPKLRSKIPVECSAKELQKIKILMEKNGITFERNGNSGSLDDFCFDFLFVAEISSIFDLIPRPKKGRDQSENDDEENRAEVEGAEKDEKNRAEVRKCMKLEIHTNESPPANINELSWSLVCRQGGSNIIGELFLLSGIGKVKATCEHISYLAENDCKFLVFAHHKAVLDGIEDYVKKMKVGYR